jgi:hypothetical protein
VQVPPVLPVPQVPPTPGSLSGAQVAGTQVGAALSNWPNEQVGFVPVGE